MISRFIFQATSKPIQHRYLYITARLAVCAMLAFGSTAAYSTPYTEINEQDSEITFTYRQMGVTMDGHFNKFIVESFRFDPDQAETGEMQISIPLASIDVGYREANDEIGNPEWLDTDKFPDARFESESLQVLSDDRYQAKGLLTIKGKTEPVSIDFSFTEHPDNALLQGEFTIERGVFGIGLNEWADTSIVAAEITVQFQLVAQP